MSTSTTLNCIFFFFKLKGSASEMNEKNVIKTDRTRGQTENLTKECGSKTKDSFVNFTCITVLNSLQTLTF